MSGRPRLTRNQARGFWAAWAGWALDGMDSFIYALVLDPALRELLPRSGVAASQANVGFYGGLLFAIFLVGWGFAFLWGPIADRFGRVRTLVLTILCYSVFTFLGSVAAGVWQLAVFRFLAGAGIGGEWTLGGVFVAEEWPESRRQQGAAWMHTGYYFGIFLAAIVNYVVGSRYGWRAVFAVGGAPALLVAFIRYGVSEPKRWQERLAQLDRRWTARDAFAALFAPEYRRRTIVNAALLFISMVGLWAGSVYVPSSVRFLAKTNGAQMASYATMLLSVGTIAGCLMLPWLAARFGRRGALGFYFALMFVCISVGFGYVFYLGDERAAVVSGVPVLPRGRRAPISRSTRCGCRSSTAPSAAAAPSLRRPRASGTVRRGAGVHRSCVGARRGARCTPSGRRCADVDRVLSGSRCCRWRMRRAERNCRL